MKQMTIVDVVKLTYPDEFANGDVAFGQDGNGPIFITKWTIPNVSEPTIEELEALMPSLQQQFDIWYFLSIGKPELSNYIDNVAQERNYDSAVSCASYAGSTVSEWQIEAETFIAWRDFVYAYTLNQIKLMQQSERSVPTFEEFKKELPSITWP